MYRGREAVLSSEAVGDSLPSQSADRVLLHLSLDFRMWLFVLLSLCVVSALAFVHLGQISYVARQVDQMEALEGQLLDLKQSNNAIRLQIAQLEQMPLLKHRAQTLGLGEPDHVEYVEAPVPEAAPATGVGLTGTIAGHLVAGAFPSPTWWAQATQQFGDWAQAGSEPAVAGAGLSTQ